MMNGKRRGPLSQNDVRKGAKAKEIAPRYFVSESTIRRTVARFVAGEMEDTDAT